MNPKSKIQNPKSLEIERKYLLRAAPPFDQFEKVQVWQVEQGYLDAESADPAAKRDGFAHGRLRKTIMPDGSARYFHSIKKGTGMVREEREQVLTREQFQAHWPRTKGRRLRKTRHRVPVGDLTWEIDVFVDLDLVLAEVELPSAEAKVTIPPWLKPLIVREVTDEPEFTNAAIARRLGLGKN